MKNEFRTIREVADLIGVKWYRIKYAHQARLVAEPLRVGNCRLYSEADVRKLKQYFNERG